MPLVAERISVALALVLAILCVAMTSGPSGRHWTSNYITAAFAPSVADAGSVIGRVR